MPENNPNYREEGNVVSPEEFERKRKQAELQREASELSEAKEAEVIRGKLFQPTFADDKLAQKAAEVLGSNPEAQKISTETVQHDLDPSESEKLHRDPKLWIEETISNPKLAAFDQINGLIQAIEDQEKKKAA